MRHPELKIETVTPLLMKTLKLLMREEIFMPFRLVGGTNISLRYGHRKSQDIDLFTDVEYGSLNFSDFENYLRNNFVYYNCPDPSDIVGFGRSYYIGDSEQESVKLDLMYTDKFLDKEEEIEGIRFARVKDIIAMKLHAINVGGRKKDFWDIHLLLDKFTLKEMISIYLQKYPWQNEEEILNRLTDFKDINYDFDPICMMNKDWDIIRLDLIETISDYRMK